MKKNNPNTATRSEKESVPLEKETLIVQLLLKCGLFLQREMNQVCRRFGLKQQQFSVLNEIVWHGPINQKELGEALLFEKSNVSKIVRILLEKKMIDVEVAPGDRRMTLLFETPEGLAVWKDCMQAFHESSTEILSLLSEDEATEAIRFLKKLQKAFKTK
ncbi:MAG TPA: MarR family transcriptional regulator [Desulfobacterales bacterium]|nr:MarR family transcriptional regulator [Desulfobacterales bacterium]